jgi:hypothetical protein
MDRSDHQLARILLETPEILDADAGVALLNATVVSDSIAACLWSVQVPPGPPTWPGCCPAKPG